MNPTDSFLNVGLKILCLTTIMIYGDLLKKVCQRLAMKYVDIRKTRNVMNILGGGTVGQWMGYKRKKKQIIFFF